MMVCGIACVGKVALRTANVSANNVIDWMGFMVLLGESALRRTFGVARRKEVASP